MDKGEMCHIQEILYRSRPAGIIGIGTAMNFIVCRIIPLGKSRNVFRWLTERDPDPVIFYLCLIDGCPRCGRRLLLWVRGKANTLARLVIHPTVIGTNQAILLHTS